jgi:ribosomal protein S7
MGLKTLSIKKISKIKTYLKFFKYVLRNNKKNNSLLRRALGKKTRLILFLKTYKNIKRQRFCIFEKNNVKFKKKKKNNNKSLYNKIVGMMTKNGLKVKSLSIVHNSLQLASKETKIPIRKVLDIVYTKLKISIEPKTIKRGKRNYIVPFPITKRRSFYLVSKWLLTLIKKKKKKIINCTEMLAEELIRTSTKKKSAALQYKKTTIRTVLQNKSNIHFRW